jgi:hypothetical protein
MERLFGHPDVVAWCALAEAEEEVLEAEETGEPVPRHANGR